MFILRKTGFVAPVRAHRSGTLTRADLAEGSAVCKGQRLGEIA